MARTGEWTAGQLLLAELEHRDEDALWEGALLLLGVLATCPVYGLTERAGVDRLRAVARSTPDPVTSLVLEVQAEHREAGQAAARVVWEQADAEVRRVGLLQLLAVVCSAVGSDHGRLRPAQTVALIKKLVRTSTPDLPHTPHPTS
ncbi:hypothetical protein [Kitasatospora paranensis]